MHSYFFLSKPILYTTLFFNIFHSHIQRLGIISYSAQYNKFLAQIYDHNNLSCFDILSGITKILNHSFIHCLFHLIVALKLCFFFDFFSFPFFLPRVCHLFHWILNLRRCCLLLALHPTHQKYLLRSL